MLNTCHQFLLSHGKPHIKPEHMTLILAYASSVAMSDEIPILYYLPLIDECSQTESKPTESEFLNPVSWIHLLPLFFSHFIPFLSSLVCNHFLYPYSLTFPLISVFIFLFLQFMLVINRKSTGK